MKKITVVALVLALGLAAVPPSGAQTPPPQTPPTTEAPITPTPPMTPPAPEAPPTATPPAATSATSAPERSCRTRKDLGEACACRSAPDEIGTVQAATDGGRNMCVVPTQ